MAGATVADSGGCGGVGDDFAAAVITQEFWQALAAHRPLHVPGAAPTLAEQVALDVVADAMARGGEVGATSAMKRGEPYMRGDSIFLAYLDQASLSLAGAERWFPSLLAVCEALSPSSFDYISARLVLEPPEAQSSALVADTDLLAIQLRGERRVAIAQSIAGLPVSAPRPQPLLNTTVRPGDALFVPCSLECRSSATTQAFSVQAASAAPALDGPGPALYVLITLRSGDQLVSASLGKYLNDLLREAPLSKETDEFFRSAITRRTRSLGGDDGQLAKAASELASHVSTAGLRAHYRARMAKLREEQKVGAAKAAKAAVNDVAPRAITGETRLRVAEGVTARCKEGDAVALFTRGPDTLRLPIAETASYLIADLSDGLPHAVKGLRCADDFEKICVCQVLVLKDCLEIVP